MLASIVEWKNGLSRSAQIGLVGGVVAILAMLAILSYWALSPSYQVLFSNLDPQDGSTIIAELDHMKIPYRLEDDGRTILIDGDQVYKTRLKLMGKGVNLKGTVGFEIFNGSDFGMTDFAQKINYQRALQGEIARTIMGLDEVVSARVHLTVPDSGLFRKNDEQAKASITVATKAGQTLTKEEVAGIQRMVAAAIPQIDPSSVTILDNRGIALSKAMAKDDPGIGNAEGRLGLKQQTENYFTQKVAGVLDRALGPGRAIVSVDITLDLNQIKVTREDVVPGQSLKGDPNGVMKSYKRQNKITRQEGRRPADGTSRQSGESTHGLETTSDSSEESEYLHGRKIEQVIGMPGSIKRMSVGVILPADVGNINLDKLSRVIEMAVGLDVARGDALAVYSIDKGQLSPLNAAESGKTDAEGAYGAGGKTTAKKADAGDSTLLALGVLALVIALIGVLVFARRQTVPRLSETERQRKLADIQAWLMVPSSEPARNSEA